MCTLIFESSHAHNAKGAWLCACYDPAVLARVYNSKVVCQACAGTCIVANSASINLCGKYSFSIPGLSINIFYLLRLDHWINHWRQFGKVLEPSSSGKHDHNSGSSTQPCQIRAKPIVILRIINARVYDALLYKYSISV